MYEYIDFLEGDYKKGDMYQRKVYITEKTISISNEDEYSGIDSLLTKKGQPPKIYALYKGDKFLDIGTLREMSQKYNIKLETLRWLSTGANIRRLKKAGQQDGYVVIKCE